MLCAGPAVSATTTNPTSPGEEVRFASDRALAMVRAPVLAIYGSRDAIIAPALSVAAAEAALGDNPDALVVAVPGMTHELTRAAGGTTGGAAGEDGTMPVVTEIVGAWLARRLETAPSDR